MARDLKIQNKALRARLRYIHRIATHKVFYASDFGRILTIERIARSSKLPADLKRIVYGGSR